MVRQDVILANSVTQKVSVLWSKREIRVGMRVYGDVRTAILRVADKTGISDTIIFSRRVFEPAMSKNPTVSKMREVGTTGKNPIKTRSVTEKAVFSCRAVVCGGEHLARKNRTVICNLDTLSMRSIKVVLTVTVSRTRTIHVGSRGVFRGAVGGSTVLNSSLRGVTLRRTHLRVRLKPITVNPAIFTPVVNRMPTTKTVKKDSRVCLVESILGRSTLSGGEKEAVDGGGVSGGLELTTIAV